MPFCCEHRVARLPDSNSFPPEALEHWLAGIAVCLLLAPQHLQHAVRHGVGQHLEDGYMTIQQRSLQTRISQKNRVVTAQTRIKVPAGDFICYKIESNLQTTCLGITTRYKISTWYAQGIGIIKSEIYRENKKLIGRQLLLSIKNK